MVKYKGYRKLPINIDTPLGTLAAHDVTSVPETGVMTEERRILSIEAVVSLEDLTAGDGPVEVGYAHSDYSAAEIEEALEAVGAWDEGNLVAQEQARRLVRSIGVLTEEETALNQGRPLKTRLNWRIATGDTIQQWIRNLGDSPTTGAVVHSEGVAHTVLV